jgi:hypothetical protein
MKVLAIFYSQSGQLKEIIDHFTAPLGDLGASVEKIRVHPRVDYPLPWSSQGFFAVMPDSVRGVPVPLELFEPREKRYDLIIVGYQAWFLSPSIPCNSLLRDPALRDLLKDTPVITITGARNMWIHAMEGVRKLLRDAGARLVGNIVLVDKHPNFISFVTILHWMFSGKKDRYLNLFPKPGVSDADIMGTGIFGNTVGKFLKAGRWEGLQAELVRQKAVVVKYPLMFIESKAGRIFSLWAKFIAKRKKRKGWLVAFKYYLLIALFIAAPIILTVDAIFFRPFLSGRIKKQKQYYLEVN